MDGNHIPLRRHSINQLDTYEVSADELDRIESECMDVGQDFQYASIALTVGVSFLTALWLTRIDSRQTFDIFVIAAILGFVGAIYFFQRYFRKRKSYTPIIERIRQRQVGPVGELGHELRPAELASMQPTQAPIVGVGTVAEIISTASQPQTVPITDAGDPK